MAADGGCNKYVVHRMNEGHRAHGVLNNRGLGLKVKCLYEGVIVPKVLYGAVAWGMRSAKRRKVNVLEMKCLKKFVGVSQMDRVRNEEVHRRADIERELMSRADLRVFRWFEHAERMDEYLMARKVQMSDASGGRVLGTPRLGRIDGVKMALGRRGMTVEAV